MDCTLSMNNLSSIESSATAHWNQLARTRNETSICSIDHLLQLLHGQSADRLGSWLGLEHTWLFGEWVDSLASRASWLFLELQVQAATNLEGTILLQLGSGQLHVVGDDSLDVLALGASLLSNCAECSSGSHGATSLHRLHC